MAYVLMQSDATTLISARQSGPVNYLAMIEEHLPELCLQDSESLNLSQLPSLRRIILLSEEARQGALSWDALLETGRTVPEAEVQQRCAATDPESTAFIMYTSAPPGFPRA